MTPVSIVLRHLPADALGLPDWARAVLAERPRPPGLNGMIVPAELGQLPRIEPRHERQERAALARTLEECLARLEPHVAVLESARRLADPSAA